MSATALGKAQVALQTPISFYRCPNDVFPTPTRKGTVSNNKEVTPSSYAAAAGHDPVNPCGGNYFCDSPCGARDTGGILHGFVDRKAVDPGKGPLGEKSSTITDGATKTVLISEKATNPKWPDYTGAVWVGVLFVTGSAVVAWAAFGDVNLDGQVNPTDISLINQGGKFGKGTSTGSVWFQGDFNYSGGVTTTDTSLIGQANLYAKGSYLPVANQGAGFGGEIGTIGSLGSQSLSALGGTALVIGVPEPGTWALAVAGLLLAPALAATRRRAPRTGPPALTGLDGGAGGK